MRFAMKKLTLIAALFIFSTGAQAFWSGNNVKTESCTCSESNSGSDNLALFNGNTQISQQYMMLSLSLLKQSQTMLTNIDGVNQSYIDAMLQLSNDIGTMADRIGEMADRIVQTEILIGEMADRILELQH